MPGVQVITAVNPGPSALSVAPAATYFVAGETERGSTTVPTLVTSLSQYVDTLGTKVSYGSVFNDLAMYFAEGGTAAYVARVVGATPTTGTLVLQDRAGSPVNTLTVTANSPGAWSANVSIEVLDDTVTNQFVINVYYKGTVVERYGGLANPAAAVTALARSAYVVVTNASSVTAAPANNPKLLTATALSAGTDDRGTVNTASYTAALAQFGPSLGAGAVAIPGQTVDSVGAALIAHGAANNRVALTAPAVGSSTSSVKSSAAVLRAQSNAEFGGVFYPWVKVSDGAGGTTLVSPEGYVAGVRARAHQIVGPWRVPAGKIAVSKFLLGTEVAIDAPTGNDLDNYNVNAIRTIGNQIQLFGYRSLSPDTSNYFFLRDRDALNYVSVGADTLLEPLVFDDIDSQGNFFAKVADVLRSLLEPMRINGGLYGNVNPNSGALVDPGYIIDTGPSVNTPTSLAQNVAKANIGIRLSPSAALIIVTVTKAAVGTPF